LITCRLRTANDVVAGAVPESWFVGVFGSTAACQGPPSLCVAQDDDRDLDVLIVYPEGHALDALRVRRTLRTTLATMCIAADVVLLSKSEAASSNFWNEEGVRDLRACAPTSAPSTP
jgi:hypothetical protein